MSDTASGSMELFRGVTEDPLLQEDKINVQNEIKFQIQRFLIIQQNRKKNITFN